MWTLHHADCLKWLESRPEGSAHAIVTDPPFGPSEFQPDQVAKLRSRRGGVWRIPPSFDGCARSPVPRFTVGTPAQLLAMEEFFRAWAASAYRVLVPGAHVLIASNPLHACVLYLAIRSAGFEQRGEFVRLVTTLRGGDRPKGAEDEFPDVTVMPRSNYEPWGIFRKPCEGTVAQNLRRYGTGALRRIDHDHPFGDVFACAPASPAERRLAPHPSLKPQKLMRHLVRASLPLGTGTVVDPFAGSGATCAAATAVGYRSQGVEVDPFYFQMATNAIPRLARLNND